LNVAGKTFAVVIPVFALLAGAIVYPGPILSPRAYLDYQRCLEIEKGMSEAQVVEQMGDPLERRIMLNGEEWLYYRYVWGASGPVVVMLVGEGGKKRVEYTGCDGTG
jgi:hypothetical protein